MRHFTSNLTTDQLYHLAKQILNNQDQRHIERLMRSPEYYRQDISHRAMFHHDDC
jgi:hypothetical protein